MCLCKIQVRESGICCNANWLHFAEGKSKTSKSGKFAWPPAIVEALYGFQVFSKINKHYVTETIAEKSLPLIFHVTGFLNTGHSLLRKACLQNRQPFDMDCGCICRPFIYSLWRISAVRAQRESHGGFGQQAQAPSDKYVRPRNSLCSSGVKERCAYDSGRRCILAI